MGQTFLLFCLVALIAHALRRAFEAGREAKAWDDRLSAAEREVDRARRLLALQRSSR